MARTEERFSDLARALTLMVARAPTLEPNEVISALGEIETSFLRKPGLSEKVRLETRRRVAEWKFRLLSERDLPIATIDKLRADARSLGFPNLETEATMEICYGQYPSRQSRFREARRALEVMRAKLYAEPRAERLRALKEEVERVLATLD